LGLDAAAEERLGLAPSADYIYQFKVVDLLTGEDVMSRTCSTTKISIGSEPECSDSLQKRDEAFEEAR
jgi:hypothetical protein